AVATTTRRGLGHALATVQHPHAIARHRARRARRQAPSTTLPPRPPERPGVLRRTECRHPAAGPAASATQCLCPSPCYPTTTSARRPPTLRNSPPPRANHAS